MSDTPKTLEQVVEEAVRAALSTYIGSLQAQIDGLELKKKDLLSEIHRAQNWKYGDPIPATDAVQSQVDANQKEWKPMPILANQSKTEWILAILHNARGRGMLRSQIEKEAQKALNLPKQPSFDSAMTGLKIKGTVKGIKFDNANTRTAWYLKEYVVDSNGYPEIKPEHMPTDAGIVDFANRKFT